MHRLPVSVFVCFVFSVGCNLFAPPLVDKSAPGLRVEGEPNGSFGQAMALQLDESGRARLVGTINPPDDVDVYSLGELLAGDRIILDVATPTSDLDATVVIFDEGGRLVYENDDRDFDLGQYDPFINHLVRHDSLVYYVAIAASPLNPTTGAYEALLTITRGGQVPPTSGQIVALDFRGGTVRLAGETYTIGPFDTADIHPDYAGMTAEVIARVEEVVRSNYEGLQLDVRVAGRDTFPAGCTYSTLLFGGRNRAAFGLASDIDLYNDDRCDDAIIFTSMFTPQRFGRVLTASELGTAIGNVASHEMGHLLGLNHVANVLDIMDTTGAATTFLGDQQFMTSPLDSTIFPFGLQDGWMLLMETLGPR